MAASRTDMCPTFQSATTGLPTCGGFLCTRQCIWSFPTWTWTNLCKWTRPTGTWMTNYLTLVISTAQRSSTFLCDKNMMLPNFNACQLFPYTFYFCTNIFSIMIFHYKIYIICGLQLPGEPHRPTRLLQLAGRMQHDGIIWLALCSIKSNNVDFLNQIRYFSIK